MASHSDPRCVVITGASRGLGRALALAYAAPGRLLALSARDLVSLNAVAEECRSQGADVLAHAVDLAEAGAVVPWIEVVEQRRPIDLFVANAGLFDGVRPDAEAEELERAIRQLRVNLEGTIRSVDAVLPAMRRRRAGHIGLISSLAAVYPLADAPAYTASKAGLAAYGDSLREQLVPLGITVSVVYPGHIATRQTEGHVGSLPQIMAAEDAARWIRRGLDRRRSRIWLPWRLAWMARLGGLLPPRLRHVTGRAQRFKVREP